MEKLLSVQSLSKSYGSAKAVDQISFEIMKGEILGLVGPNGAGKSTIIRCILGIKEADSGEIEFAFASGKKLDSSKVGYLPEERGLYKDVKIIDILMYLAELKNYPKKKAHQRAMEYLDKFGLKDRAKSKIQELSKGMAQKVQLIASIIHEPEFLILDEPLSGLDPVSQNLFIQEIKSLAENGTTILLSSHQMDMVESMCNRIFMINKGKQVLYGDINSIKERLGSYRCRISGMNREMDFSKNSLVDGVEVEGGSILLHLKKNASPSELLKELSLNTELKELHIERTSLHDIFVELVTGGTAQ